ncbi:MULTISPECIES: lmo0937 family membrane protein [Planomicrobium]|uniref:Lmo0937 family membrane protein n=1 Tax=Planomicrobium okeanokoites TaxID=244 RepID=A0ABV7KK99_PLAOK|nr:MULTISPECIES: lmo0937 family membrane protein [Planomicrobium]MCM3612284.1 lmo0937 family membrane protein [Planococcus sp. MER TA 32b]RLQ90726.1 lmo0937 family membrane protein [Planomicrobium sp. Y74]TAA68783.1 lmo0937 family membrane protein [Planomicrobium okeanokoites]
MARILWIILVVILAIWLIGFLMDVAGGLIHLLLIVAAIILIVNLISGRKGI